MNTSESICPCRVGSSAPKNYQDCCQPYHSGDAIPPTPEALMRSRFSAFYTANADYLVATHHPSQRENNEKQALHNSFSETQWDRLEVLSTAAGKEGDTEGYVTFTAHFTANGKADKLQEKSRFIKEDGSWYYLEGELPEIKPSKVGRNDPCWCGSGKKFKKCHG